MDASDSTSAQQPTQLNYEAVKNWPFEPLTESYGSQQVIDYAHGIGVGMPGPLAADEAQYLSDGSDLSTLPMMAIVMNQGAMWTQDPATGIDWRKTVHAEESITMHRPIPAQGALVATYQVDEVYDKGPGKGALMYESRHLALADGTPVATVSIATFLRGNGGFGGAITGAPKPVGMPLERKPDRSIDISTPVRNNQTYQLGEEFVESIRKYMVLPDKPMLRGVCSFGLAGRAVLNLACGGEAKRLKHLGLRYIAPIFSDETLRTELWFIGEGKAVFRVSCVERDLVVLDNGVVEFDAHD